MRLHLVLAAMGFVRAFIVRPAALACGRRGLVSMSGVEKSGASALKLTQAPIKSTDNEKVKLMRSLLKTKKKRDELGLIVLEGHRQVIDAVAVGLAPTLVLVSERAVTTAPLADKLLDALAHCSSALGTQVGCVEESILDRACSDVVTSQGVVAAFSRPSAPAAGSFSAVCPLLVLLDRPTDPGNVGTVIRTAFGLGADALVVVEGCDAFSPKVSRASMGTNLQLPILETTWDGGAVESLLISLLQSSSSASASDAGPDSRVLQLLLAVPDPSADPYFSVDLSLPTVIAVGSEAHGLSDACFGLADAFSSQKARPGAGADNGLTLVARKVFIPTARPLESFNAAMAATLLLGEAARQRFSSSGAGSRSEGAQGTVKGKSKGNKGKSIKDAQ